MQKNYTKIVLQSLLTSLIGVFGIDLLSHRFFSNPMETTAYFVAKMVAFFIFSLIFLSLINLSVKELLKVCVAGIIIASLRGGYYNVLPALFDYYPFGIPLEGLTFLGMGLIGTGIAFGIVHTLAFIGGYYASKKILRKMH